MIYGCKQGSRVLASAETQVPRALIC